MKIFNSKLHKDRGVVLIREPGQKKFAGMNKFVLLTFSKLVLFTITKDKGICWLLCFFSSTNVNITF